MEAHVTTPVFEGPAELLLQLVNTHQLDIYDIPLAPMVEAFVAELATWEEVDLAGCCRGSWWWPRCWWS